ncbi:MAG TPA: glycosyltransferase [Thermoanaerobaculia bacterium]|jgi:glycosyltransferase involved in cell wall biosynthesis|nr:glycosyltransferase [Thermoanaerobaculia bacterium]HEV8609555.1 glycosyltransferase [Thermoanaerobaculia bacterium]
MRGIERVALLGPAPPDRGGIARETALLARELETRVALSWFTFSRPYPHWLNPRRFDRSPGDPATQAARPSLDYRSVRSWKRTAREIASSDPDVLIAPWWTSFWGVPLRSVLSRVRALSPRTPRVLLCHNVSDHEARLLERFLTLGAYLAADGFVVHSETDRARLARRVPGRPIAVLPHPVVDAPQPSRDVARRTLGITTPLVLFLGLVRRYKGVDVLLDAAPRIVRETGATIAVVGEVFPESRYLARRWEHSAVRDSILWRDDYVSEEEMSRWLAACDVVVLPYRYVSGSGIAARALAARRPMAAAAVGGLSQTVRPGATGELFTPADPDALARAVEHVLGRGIEFYEPGLAASAEQASWPRYVDGLLSFFGSLSAES